MTNNYMIIRNGADRIRGLMDNIRGFSRISDRVELRREDLNEALENTLMLAHSALKYGITVHRQWKVPLYVKCDINALKQVFLNLILNAAQAMEGVGELWIRGGEKNESVFLDVADSGPGIPDRMQDRIFDAFYTSKEDGTGLGLSIVKGIVDRHNGTISVESEPGKGTTFHVVFPVA